MRFTAAILDDPSIDMAVLDHHGVVEHRHVSHAAVPVPRVKVGSEHRILFGSRGRRTHMADHVGIALGDSTHVARRCKIRSDYADRYAGPATLAGRTGGG